MVRPLWIYNNPVVSKLIQYSQLELVYIHKFYHPIITKQMKNSSFHKLKQHMIGILRPLNKLNIYLVHVFFSS